MKGNFAAIVAVRVLQSILTPDGHNWTSKLVNIPRLTG